MFLQPNEEEGKDLVLIPATRRKELAIRLSLRAQPLRIVRQLLTQEALIIAFLGGSLGVLLSAQMAPRHANFKNPRPEISLLRRDDCSRAGKPTRFLESMLLKSSRSLFQGWPGPKMPSPAERPLHYSPVLFGNRRVYNSQSPESSRAP